MSKKKIKEKETLFVRISSDKLKYAREVSATNGYFLASYIEWLIEMSMERGEHPPCKRSPAYVEKALKWARRAGNKSKTAKTLKKSTKFTQQKNSMEEWGE